MHPWADAMESLESEIRALRVRAKRLGDETRCPNVMGMEADSLRCGRPRGHEGDCLYGDPATELERLRAAVDELNAGYNRLLLTRPGESMLADCCRANLWQEMDNGKLVVFVLPHPGCIREK